MPVLSISDLRAFGRAVSLSQCSPQPGLAGRTRRRSSGWSDKGARSCCGRHTYELVAFSDAKGIPHLSIAFQSIIKPANAWLLVESFWIQRRLRMKSLASGYGFSSFGKSFSLTRCWTGKVLWHGAHSPASLFLAMEGQDSQAASYTIETTASPSKG